MLEKKGKGTTIEDLQKVKGGIIGMCGHDGCSVCGSNNQGDLEQSYLEWLRTDF